jgi:hypothetical protein
MVLVRELPATFTTRTALGLGVHPRDLYAGRDSGVLVELSRGVFRRADAQHIGYGPARDALLATAGFRGTRVVPLSTVLDNLIALRRAAYVAYRTGLGPDGQDLPADFADVVAGVAAFADPIVGTSADPMTWDPDTRRWLDA